MAAVFGWSLTELEDLDADELGIWRDLARRNATLNLRRIFGG